MKVTVVFGERRIVVPCGDGSLPVRTLADEAARRFRNTSHKPGEWRVRVRRLEGDCGILDPQDRLKDVAEDRDQIIAVYDEEEVRTSSGSSKSVHSSFRGSSTSQSPSSQPSSLPSSQPDEERRFAVEVRDLERLPAPGLLVVAEPQPPSSPESPLRGDAGPSRTEPAQTSRSSSQYRKRQAPRPPSHSVSPPPGGFRRDAARKSSLSTFLEQGLHLQEEFASNNPQPLDDSSHSAADGAPAEGLVFVQRFLDKPLGLQVKPLYAPSQKLQGVEVTGMLESGRAFLDGQLREGDVILEISERPLYQMSFVRAQKYLHEASESGTPLQLRIRRLGPISPAAGPPKAPDSLPQALPDYNGPEATLQKANTKRLGEKLSVDLVKQSQGGLGFSVTSRDTPTGGQRQFFIKTISARGAAISDGRLQVGDRLLSLNGESVEELTQQELVAKLRAVAEGETAALEISRAKLTASSNPTTPARPESPPRAASPPRPMTAPPPAPAHSDSEPSSQAEDGVSGPASGREFVFDIPLNSSGCAGLGVSVKGRMVGMVGSGEEPKDCGIFVKTIMHGGAAHKDGRLRTNDQLLAVNDTELRGISNEDAIAAITKSYARLQAVSPSANSIRLRVLRHDSPPPQHTPQPSAADSQLYAVVQKERGSPLAESRRPPAVLPSEQSNGAGEYEEVVVVDSADGRLREGPNGSASGNGRGSPRPSVESLSLGGSDPFDRDSSMRKSLSEKRHMAASNNPNHIKTFLQIKSQRQASAPAMDKLEDSVDAVSLQPRPHNANSRAGMVGVGSRRSLSMESLSGVGLGAGAQPMIHELAMGGSGRRARGAQPRGASREAAARRLEQLRAGDAGRAPPNESFRAAVDRSFPQTGGKEAAVDVGSHAPPRPSQPPPPQPPHQPPHHPSAAIAQPQASQAGHSSHSLPRQTKAEKRKSAGPGFFARLRLGSEHKGQGKREAEEEGQEQRQRRAMEDEQRRIREQYERLRRQQPGLYPVQPRLGPPPQPPSSHLGPKGAADRASSRSQGSPYLHRRHPPPPYLHTAYPPKAPPPQPHFPPQPQPSQFYGRQAAVPLPFNAPPTRPPPHGSYIAHGRQASQPLSYTDYAEIPWFARSQEQRGRALSSERAWDVGWAGEEVVAEEVGGWASTRRGARAEGRGSGRGRLAGRAASPTSELASDAPPSYSHHLRLSQRRSSHGRKAPGPNPRLRPASNLVDYRHPPSSLYAPHHTIVKL